MIQIPIETLRASLAYDPDTGVVRWLIPPASNVKKGAIAGCTAGGYVLIGFNKCHYLAHRIAWALYHGEWPSSVIDHINGDGLDNKITNLRLATSSQNSCNARRSSRSTSGIKGVHFYKRTGKWQAHIYHKGRAHHLGLFPTKGLAAVARAKAAIRYHGKFARLT